MRTVRLRGGLGNQLFGLAFARSLRHPTGAPVRIDIGGFAGDRYGRDFMTAGLAADLGLEVVSLPTLRALLSRLALPGRYFDGYWQNEAHFTDPDIVRVRFRAFLDARGGAAPAHDIVVHHRGYREEILPGRRTGPAPDYLARALDLIEARHGATTDIVHLSDDPPGADPFADMATMLNARALVLANSSFSWWAGYCGDATLVTYPARGGAFHYPAPAARFVVI